MTLGTNGSLALVPAHGTLLYFGMQCSTLIYFCFILLCFSLSCFIVISFLEAFSFLMRDWKGVSLEGRESGEQLGGEEEGETIIRICCMRKYSTFNKMKKYFKQWSLVWDFWVSWFPIIAFFLWNMLKIITS